MNEEQERKVDELYKRYIDTESYDKLIHFTSLQDFFEKTPEGNLIPENLETITEFKKVLKEKAIDCCMEGEDDQLKSIKKLNKQINKKINYNHKRSDSLYFNSVSFLFDFLNPYNFLCNHCLEDIRLPDELLFKKDDYEYEPFRIAEYLLEHHSKRIRNKTEFEDITVKSIFENKYYSLVEGVNEDYEALKFDTFDKDEHTTEDMVDYIINDYFETEMLRRKLNQYKPKPNSEENQQPDINKYEQIQQILEEKTQSKQKALAHKNYIHINTFPN